MRRLMLAILLMLPGCKYNGVRPGDLCEHKLTGETLLYIGNFGTKERGRNQMGQMLYENYQDFFRDIDGGIHTEYDACEFERIK